jgi:hypothetical protein
MDPLMLFLFIVKSYMEAMDEIDTLQSKTDSCLVIDGES